MPYEVVKSQKGCDCLQVEGYMFTTTGKGLYKGRYWVCSRKHNGQRCKARFVLNNGLIEKYNGEHIYHPPNRVRAKKTEDYDPI